VDLLQCKFNPRSSSLNSFARVTTWQARVRNCVCWSWEKQH